MNHIAANRAVFNTTIAAIEADMSLVMTMNDSQRRYWDFLLGRTREEPAMTLVNRADVENWLAYVIYGYPIADHFDDVRFPGITVVRRIRREELRRLANVEQPLVTKRDNRQRRRATRSVATFRR